MIEYQLVDGDMQVEYLASFIDVSILLHFASMIHIFEV